jgi:hypothetical protein
MQSIETTRNPNYANKMLTENKFFYIWLKDEFSENDYRECLIDNILIEVFANIISEFIRIEWDASFLRPTQP